MNELQNRPRPALSLPLPERSRSRGMAEGLLLFHEEINQALESVRDAAQGLAGMYAKAPFDPSTVHQTLASNLAENLLSIVMRTLVLELNVARVEDALEGETAAERFEHFVRRLRTPEVARSLLAEYPVLAEQIANRLQLWAAYSVEFLRYLCADWKELVARFFTTDPGKLTETRFGSGDSHRHGRSVIVLRFSSGDQLVYKPRAMAVDEHFNELLCWLNQKGAQPQFRQLNCLNKGDHGWAEFVRREECRSAEEVKRFYQRQGALLAVLYTLQATDFHRENLIAAGEHPMLIDLEALFQPRHPHAATGNMTADALGFSALRTGLLPAPFLSWDMDDGLDMSGLGGAGGQIVSNGGSQWEQPETDEMHLVTKSMQLPDSDNRPLWNGQEIDALPYTQEIAAGFAHMYDILLRHSGEALALIQHFADDEVRVIARPTQIYAYFLHDASHPDMQRDPAERDKLFDRLIGMDAFRPAEQIDMRRGDVPIFTTRADSRHVWTSDGERIDNYFNQSGMSLVQRRIQDLSARDLGKQLWVVRASMATMSSANESPTHTKIRTNREREITADELLAEACKIGDRLNELSFETPQIVWLGLTQRKEKLWSLSALDTDLYDGLPGVILFLAYLGNVTGTNRYTALARAALESLRQLVDKSPQTQRAGGFSGWGGLLYCYAHLAALWNDDELLAEAGLMASKSAELIATDEVLDVTGGVAGLALQLRSLRGSRNQEIARECGKRLQATAISMEHGVGWLAGNIAKVPLTGFAHGNAGIAFALLELSTLCDEPGFAAAAEKGFEYERSVFSAEHGNWPDFRHPDKVRFSCAWCHGAPGIALSRLGALRHAPTELLFYEIGVGLDTSVREGLGGNHSLCHGDLGNIEILLYASAVLDDPAWMHKARRLAGGAIDRAKESGWICGNDLGVESPGLMTGIAGIGYELLRLAYPDRVPSVLALEPPIQV